MLMGVRAGELRAVRAADAEMLYALVDADRRRLAEAFAWAGRATLESQRRFCRESEAAAAAGTAFSFAILGEDEELVGCCGIRRRGVTPLTGEIGIWIASDHVKEGLATAAVEGMIAFAREHGYHRLEARIVSDNLGSLRTGMKCGFRIEGMLEKEAAGGPRGYRDTFILGLVLD
jgi:RimJ/RimL family protein N-acetyltransferase